MLRAFHKTIEERSIFWTLWPIAHKFARAGHMMTAEHILALALAIRPTDPTVIYALGSLQAQRGDVKSALRLFRNDVAVPTSLGSPTYTRALCFDGVDNFSRQRIVNFVPTKFAGRAVYFVAGDSVYFCRYAAALSNSILRNAPGLLLHVHIVNPSEEALALAARLPGISVSSEKTDLDGLTELQCKTFYSCSRYLMLPDVLDCYSTTVLVCDFDQIVTASPDPLLAAIDRADVAMLRLQENVYSLLALYCATAVVIANNAGGKNFADKLCENIRRALTNDDNLVWHLDQGALAMTRFMIPTLREAAIERSLIGLAGEPETSNVLWSVTNSLKANASKLNAPHLSAFNTNH